MKFQEVSKKQKIAFKAQSEFAKKYGFKEWRGGYMVVWGGISSLCTPNVQPDPKIWGKGAEKGEFFPKKNSKDGLTIYNEIKELPEVDYEELNLCIGFRSTWHHIGFAESKEYFGFIVDEKWKVKVPEDCTEITTTEYNKMFD